MKLTPEDISHYIGNLRARHAELENALADPAIYAQPEKSRKYSQEHRKLEYLFASYDAWLKNLADIESNKALLATEEDAEMREMAAADIEELEARAEKLENTIKIALLPSDPNDEKNIIIEIRPAAGGDEAALFAAELFRLYLRYAESRRWKVDILEQSSSELGGIKDVAFSLSGEDVYSRMKYESGVHRVQRVPATEAGGRIHTSTVTVSVMPEAEEVELNVRPDELRFEVFRSSGPGGQSVNTTDSAVRAIHIPTGLSVASQQEKSQHRNKEIALRILFARLLELKQSEEQAKLDSTRRSQVGTGDRSERIRTYNYPQNRITDHRFGITLHSLPAVLEGDLDQLVDPILQTASERQLESLRSL